MKLSPLVYLLCYNVAVLLAMTAVCIWSGPWGLALVFLLASDITTKGGNDETSG